MDFQKLDKKWREKWKKARLFEANVDPKRKKFFSSLVIAYVNGDLHMGHLYTFARTDAYARFKRMQGYNVLLAQGFHATGEPILGVVERLRNGDKKQIETLRTLGASKHDIENFAANGPEFVARYWTDKIVETSGMIGFSVDFRRKFITAVEEPFNKFIEWQYNTLKKNGYVSQGTHPVVWCSHCESPTGDHDRLEGEGESPAEFTILKFKLDDTNPEYPGPIFLVAATLRPETIYGVTNIWLKPHTEYVMALVENEIWIVSEECFTKLSDQLYEIREVGRLRSIDIIGKRCIDPIGNRSIPILPADFVDMNNATGVVMSVPSHAPYDWIAIKELIDTPGELDRYGVNPDELEPIPMVETDEFGKSGDSPAVELCKQMGIIRLQQVDLLDKATSILYKKEFHSGVLNKNCGEFAGQKVSDVKEPLIQEFVKSGVATNIWEITGKVICRCMNECHVKILEDQWFLNFSDKKWKENVRKLVKSMSIYPEEARTNFLATIDWLKDKACARRSGLGTRMPWDPSWIIETLSDSTVYMAYYTIAKTINEHGIDPGSLTEDVFDFVFYDKGSVKKVAKESGLSEKILIEMRKEFEYWYPLDLRNSGKDLVQNHLTYFLFQHTALFPEKLWPRGIGVNGFVNIEGEKMSKSKGNFLVLRDIVSQYGADLVRVNMISSAEGLDDADWRIENIGGFRSRLLFLYELATDFRKAKRRSRNPTDNWLASEIQCIIDETTLAYDELRFRTGIYSALFNSINAIKWYIKRNCGIENVNSKTLQNAIETVTKLMSPATPFSCEEIWEKLGKKGFISIAEWPKSDKTVIDEDTTLNEKFIKKTKQDVNQIKQITKKSSFSKMTLVVARTKQFENAKKKKSQLETLKSAI
ncbi:MAG: leucine--tRNA ligase, partial [Candidatus Aenigmatarchaeota archaeon]